MGRSRRTGRGEQIMNTLNLNEKSEEYVATALKDMKEVHNSLQQQLYKLKERISLFQRVLLKKQEERLLTQNALSKNIDTAELERKTGLSREQILKAMTLIKHEQA